MEQSAEAFVEAGNALAMAGDYAGAARSFESALALEPDYVAAHNNYALALTALGRLREAWAHAEWRFRLQPEMREFMARAPLPLWRGEPIEDELLVLWEQAFGDMLQYLRFLSLAAKRVGALGFLCPPELRRLVAASFPTVELLPAQAAVTWTDYAAYIPLLSLPHALALDDAGLPAEPYLHAAPADRRAADQRLGIIWRASRFDPTRSCPLYDFLPLVEAGLSLVSLQADPNGEERARLRSWNVEELGSQFKDFYDTAVTMASLRAVVSVDTAAAHLAGGLGVPTHLVLNEPAAVRWMQGTERTPWYPSMRLHRKHREEPWAPLLTRIAALLPG